MFLWICWLIVSHLDLHEILTLKLCHSFLRSWNFILDPQNLWINWEIMSNFMLESTLLLVRTKYLKTFNPIFSQKGKNCSILVIFFFLIKFNLSLRILFVKIPFLSTPERCHNVLGEEGVMRWWKGLQTSKIYFCVRPIIIIVI